MGAECHAFFADFAEIVQTKNLEAAGIGENGSIPRHKPVQSAHLPNCVDSWTQIEMVGIGEQNLDAEFLYTSCETPLTSKRSNWHENGRLDFSMGSDELARAGRAASRFNLQVERQEGIVTWGI